MRTQEQIENELKPLLQQRFEIQQKIDELSVELSENGKKRAEKFNSERDQAGKQNPFTSQGEN